MARNSSFPILIVDDEIQFLQSAAITLRVAGLEVVTCLNSKDVLDTIASRNFGAVVLDIMMPEISGTELLSEIIKISPSTQVIMLTAINDIETAVDCMRRGAFDYLLKPVEKDRLVTTIRSALDIVELRNENKMLKDRLLFNKLDHPEYFEPIVTRNSRMIAIFQYIEAIAQTSMPVLVQGETGTGKELIAQAIHRASGRKGEFVSVNAAGVTDTLFCDTLFGHERGAFTGADAKRGGLVAKASGGTLFLDEIGDLSFESQVKLLRLLEERTYYPTGSDTPRISDARFVVATNKDLTKLQKDGTFRTDLYYRLDTHKITLPPLRERKDDIALLADFFIEESSLQLHKEAPELPENIQTLLMEYSFPGNIRELRNMIIDAVSTTKDTVIDQTGLLERLHADAQTPHASLVAREFTKETISRWDHLPTLKEAEQMLIDESLRRAGNNQALAAQYLGLTRFALNKRLIRAKSSEIEGV